EIHANEIVLLSYYIAAINIEETFHSLYGGEYVPFEGIVLTDTFESTEHKDSFMDELFDENNERLKKQQQQPIFAIIGNPPYSARQTIDSNQNKNENYPILDEAIKNTYVKHSTARNKNTLYDPLVRSFRWSTDRLGSQGVIGFVVNGSFIDTPTGSGIRKYFYEEFNYIYFFNLRGDQRTQGEQSRREGGKIFDSGSRNLIAIMLLIKDGSSNHQIFYNDIGDYLTRNEKLSIIENAKSMSEISWKRYFQMKTMIG